MSRESSTQAGLGNLAISEGASADPIMWPTCAGPGCGVKHFFVYGYFSTDDGAVAAVHGRACGEAYYLARASQRPGYVAPPVEEVPHPDETGGHVLPFERKAA